MSVRWATCIGSEFCDITRLGKRVMLAGGDCARQQRSRGIPGNGGHGQARPASGNREQCDNMRRVAKHPTGNVKSLW